MKLKNHIFNIISILLILISCYLCYLGYEKGMFDSLDSFRQLILSKGSLAPLAFMVIQIIQVVVPIIPGGLTTVAGVVIFGAFWGFIYNYISICIGSIIVFFISRTFGKSVIIMIFGQELFDKYESKINEKSYEKFFAIAIFLPVAPDDFLCYLSGVTNMSVKKFITIILLCKPASIFAYSMGWALGLDFLVHKYL